MHSQGVRRDAHLRCPRILFRRSWGNRHENTTGPIHLRKGGVSGLSVSHLRDGYCCPMSFKVLNHSTRDSDTRCLGHIDIACVRVLPVYECCVARFRSTFSWESFLSCFAFQEGMWDTHISVLGGLGNSIGTFFDTSVYTSHRMSSFGSEAGLSYLALFFKHLWYTTPHYGKP